MFEVDTMSLRPGDTRVEEAGFHWGAEPWHQYVICAWCGTEKRPPDYIDWPLGAERTAGVEEPEWTCSDRENCEALGDRLRSQAEATVTPPA